MSSNRTIGYCTNVHAGTDIQQIQANLDEISVPVRRTLDRGPMGVGLWIPAEAAGELANEQAVISFREWLEERELVPFTINGFPYGNFHQAVVKQRVYHPTWWEDARRDYTLQLVDILHSILPGNEVGSISTLPLGWGTPQPSDQQMNAAATNLRTVAQYLEKLENESGRRICIAIEPEPGCVLDTTKDMIDFFDRFIPEANLRRYLTVCHDICHTAVMYEQQAEALQQYADSGVGIGKVQVSSAIAVDWEQMDESAKVEAIAQLKQFAEDKYLHQTSVMSADGSIRLVDDLPTLIESTLPSISDKSWRIHFHVPIYLEAFGQLKTTRDAVQECLQSLDTTASLEFTGHLEAETYAWGVLPPQLQTDNLAEGIAREIQWLHEQVSQENE